MMVDFRPVLHDDIPDLITLANEIWNEYFSSILSQEQVDYIIATHHTAEFLDDRIHNRGRRYFFIVNGPTTLGYYSMSPRKDALVVKIYIKKEFRGKGYGKAALKRIYKICKEEGYSKIYLAVEKKNTAALEAFKGRGFTIDHSQTTDLGNGYSMDVYIMVKPL